MSSNRLSEGYDRQFDAVITQINDVKVKNLAHVVEVLRDMQDEGIRYQYSADLREIWQAKEQ